MLFFSQMFVQEKWAIQATKTCVRSFFSIALLPFSAQTLPSAISLFSEVTLPVELLCDATPER